MQKGILNDVIQYVYHEFGASEKEKVRKIIFSNPEIEEEFYNLIVTKKMLDGIVYQQKQPSKKSINRILDFSLKMDSIPLEKDS